MNTEQLLQATHGKKDISIALDIIENIGGFQEGKDDCSLESLFLTLNKNQPIKKYSFNVNKLKEWCDKNNLEHCIDELNRIVHLRRKS